MAVLAADAGPFEAEGVVTQVFGDATNRFDFRVTALADGRYQILTEDHFDPPTRRVVGHDGTDFYQLDTVRDDRGRGVEFGHVHTGVGPTNLYGLGDLLRLGFLARRSGGGVGGLTNIGFFDGNRPLFGESRAEVVREGPPGAGFFEELRFVGRRDPSVGDEPIGGFRVDQVTRHQGMSLPLRFSLESRLPASVDGGEPRWIERLTAQVHRVGDPTVADPLPLPVTDRVQVTDARFVGEIDKPLLYTLTNRTWVPRDASWLRERVRDLRLRKLASEGRLKARRMPAYFVLLFLVTLPVVIHLHRSRRAAGTSRA